MCSCHLWFVLAQSEDLFSHDNIFFWPRVDAALTISLNFRHFWHFFCLLRHHLSLFFHSLLMFLFLFFSRSYLLFVKIAYICLPFSFFVGWAISRCLSNTPHPIGGQGGSVLLVHYSMIMLKPAILILMAVVRYNHTPIHRLTCRFIIQPVCLSLINHVHPTSSPLLASVCCFLLVFSIFDCLSCFLCIPTMFVYL